MGFIRPDALFRAKTDNDKKHSHLKASVTFFVALVTIIAISAITPLKALSAQTTLSWNASASREVTGYTLYYGAASGSYSQNVDVGSTTSYTLSNLVEGQTYYFAAKAYDAKGNQSDFSNEVSKSIAAAPVTYTITATAGSGGTITAVNNTNVSTGSNGTSTVTAATVLSGAAQSFTITPASGYKISGVTVDGVSVGTVSSYTFSNVTANHTITANFAANTTSSYTITSSAGTGGVISPAGTTTVTSGGSKTYSITPNSGYTISGVTVDGASIGALSSCTFSNVTANHTIRASFVSSSPAAGTVVFAANAGGSKYTSAAGITYLADTNYSGGTASAKTVSISSTTDDTLYSSERYGDFSYNIPVTNGNYNVTLKMAELYWTATGKRIFDVKINGKTVISNLDLYAKIGKNKAYDISVPVNVTTGAVNISFVSKVNNATVSGIHIVTR